MNEGYKAEGYTDAERYLARLGEKSFLTFWSYPNVYRDEGDVARGGDGKEIADLLVVCGNHVLIFSDKDCEYKDYGDSVLNWKRWYKKAIFKSAQQVYGAESWIRRFPNRLFCDRKCKVPLPIELPPSDQMKVHRIVVAHGITEHCRKVMGGTGSLQIDTTIFDKYHYEDQGSASKIIPFKVGIIDSARGYIHVLDDASLDIVMQNLDTITDFVRYLERKENVICSQNFKVFASGEADLMATYLTTVNKDDKHDFLFRPEAESVEIEAGYWNQFSMSEEYKRQQQVDEVSYLWDHIIEFVVHHYNRKTLYFSTDNSFKSHEYLLRILAQESRLGRRMLANSIIAIAEKSKKADYANRIILSSEFPHICYAIFLFAHLNGYSYDQYREMRRDFMKAYAQIVKLKFFGKVKTIVVMGSEIGGLNAMGSWDILTIEAESWDPGEKESSERLFEALPFTKDTQHYWGHEDEYPPAGE